jgi:hypothetical protein
LQKNKLLIISIISALIVCSALSVAAAQDESPIDVSTDPTVAPDTIVNPDDSRSPTDDNQNVSGDDPVLYSIGDDNSTDTNSTDPIDIAAEDGLLYSNTVADQNTPDNTWIVAAIGVVLAVVVGGTISVVYFHKTKAKN